MNEIPELTKELKQFGCILGILIAVVFGVVIPWLWSALTFPNVYIIGIGLGVTIFSLVFPSQVIYLYKPYMRLAFIHWQDYKFNYSWYNLLLTNFSDVISIKAFEN